MWMSTRVPLTRANLMAYTHAPRKKMERWLDEMVAEGVVEVDADDDGEMIWTVRGAVRSKVGPESMAEAHKVEGLRNEVAGATSALTLAARAAGLTTRGPARRGPGGAIVSDEKSVIASGALSFFFGPIGWLYAAPLKEALPAIFVYMIVCSVMPHFLLLPLLAIAHPIAGIAGAAYAWRYNQKGERTALAADVRKALPGKRG